MIATSISPVRSSSIASGGCMSVTLTCSPGWVAASAATAPGDQLRARRGERRARRTRPAVSPTCAASSASAASIRPRISAARSASSRPAGVSADAPAHPLEQLGAGLGLQPPQVVGHRGLRVVQLLRRRRDRLVTGDGLDHPQPVHVEHASTLSMGQAESWHWTHESPSGRLLHMTRDRDSPHRTHQARGRRPRRRRRARRAGRRRPALVSDQLRLHPPRGRRS